MVFIPLLLKETDKHGVLINKFGEICGIFRKILRIGKFFLNSKSIYDKLNTTQKVKLSTILSCLSIASEAFYCLADHVLLLSKIQAWKFSPTVMRICEFNDNFLWLCETVFAIASDMSLYSEMEKEKTSLLEKKSNQDSINIAEDNTTYDKERSNLQFIEEALKVQKLRKQKMLTNQIRLWSDFFVCIYHNFILAHCIFL